MTLEEICRLKVDITQKATNFSRTQKQTVGEKNDYYITLEQLQTILEDSCPCLCEYDDTYGFIADEDCVVHNEEPT